jgi:hypothetical protein
MTWYFTNQRREWAE